MIGQCKCGSRAINDDPDRLLCDTCLRDAEIERLRGGLDECRRLLREACDSIDRAVKPFDDGKSYLASMPDFLNEEWHKRAIVQAARAAGGEE